MEDRLVQQVAGVIWAFSSFESAHDATFSGHGEHLSLLGLREGS